MSADNSESKTKNDSSSLEATTAYLPSWQDDALNLDMGWQEQTLAVRAGQHRSDEGEHAEALYMTSSYVYQDAQMAADHFSGDIKGNIYSRYTNPTVRMFERRLAALEGGEAAVATSSGMGAIMTMAMSLLQAGDHMVAAKQLFGSTIGLFDNYFAKFGVEISYVDLSDNKAWSAAVQDNTKVVYIESPSNPLAQIADIGYLSQLCKANDILLVVDNCFCSPALQKPLQLGADIVIHSATKYLDGQGRALGGALVGSHELMERVTRFVRSAGPSMSPFNAWIFLKGLETLSLRMRVHCDNAIQVAKWLDKHPKVSQVYYAGLPDSPYHELAQRQQQHFGAIVGFDVIGGRAAAWQVIDSTQMISITNNLGDAKSTITHPASTTHSRLSEAERQAAGVSENLLRLSVGLEDVQDIIRDLSTGLDAL